MMNVKPFDIAVPQADIDDLNARLRLTRFPDQINDARWNWGTDLNFMRMAVDHWLERFDWRAQESRLNAVPNFIADTTGNEIHFMHVKGAGPRTLPLLLTHGWPGSAAEMLAIIPLLTTVNPITEQAGLTFDLVIPSLPGFGFSSKPKLAGTSPAVIAATFHELMTGLGYDRFGVQGGDFGAGISMRIALEHPESVVGVHTNFPNFVYGPTGSVLDSDAGRMADARRDEWRRDEGGYFHMHATRPQTLGYALNDSPAGLAAWICEKFYAWSDRSPDDGDLPFHLDDLLMNVSIYWFTQTITSSMRIYRESSADPLVLSPERRIEVPYGVAAFPAEIPIQPRERVGGVVNLRRWTDMSAGGHFAALQVPHLLAGEIVSFFAEDVLNDN